MAPVTAHIQDDQLLISMSQDALPLEQAVRLLELFCAAAPQHRSACLNSLGSGATAAAAGQTDTAAPAALSDDENRYMGMIQRSLRQRDEHAIDFLEADLFALGEARRLGIRLTARQRNTLIQYYVERLPADPAARPTGGSSREAALARARLLAERMHRKT